MVNPLINTNGDTRCNQSDRARDRCHDDDVELPSRIRTVAHSARVGSSAVTTRSPQLNAEEKMEPTREVVAVDPFRSRSWGTWAVNAEELVQALAGDRFFSGHGRTHTHPTTGTLGMVRADLEVLCRVQPDTAPLLDDPATEVVTPRRLSARQSQPKAVAWILSTSAAKRFRPARRSATRIPSRVIGGRRRWSAIAKRTPRSSCGAATNRPTK